MCAGGKIGKDSCSVSFNNVFSWRTTLHIDRSLLYLLWNNIYSVFFHRETVVDLWLQDLQIWKATWLLELFLEARLGRIGRFDCFQAVWLVSLDLNIPNLYLPLEHKNNPIPSIQISHNFSGLSFAHHAADWLMNWWTNERSEKLWEVQPSQIYGESTSNYKVTKKHDT